MLLGFLLGPAVGIIVYGAYGFGPLFLGLHVSKSIEGFSLILTLLIPAYVLTVVLSMPVFLLVRYLHKVNRWTSVAAALVTVLTEGMLLKLYGDEGINELFQIHYLIASTLGAVAYGLTFWLIVGRGSHDRGQVEVPRVSRTVN